MRNSVRDVTDIFAIPRLHLFCKCLSQRERTEDSDAGASLFSGMTLTPSLGTGSDNQRLMSHTDVTPAAKEPQKQSSLIDTDTENIQGLTTVLGKIFKCLPYIMMSIYNS